ncbi:sister chromatid cohesion 1 protein 4 isoform X2 [Lactuca sativa]|uniref:sister chromatid cohesion 1 protein 4 isoform X2 n=1 Tax=Lactuca sativa TaxID=4236 RepID=UPI000CD86C35|nr:sister chromatid cohesion 1 protein 4 isoform X2 [Lactuca sativa]
MFYSQFILAKKGPLGTIWIAAHLERKLRKNQVSDTDIGVSVDSILFPEMPIALRLSSHLLLGVVRIYSKKVSYLFDDCSEALLKVKNAFRANAVDLPPEESTAPYHAITLPETFDLDDFELPDNENLQGFVDHHVGAKEQITLQDTMEGVVYTTSEFGRDERFGDGEASHLDLNEELVVEKAATTAVDTDTDTLNSNVDLDPQASSQAKTPAEPAADTDTDTLNLNSVDPQESFQAKTPAATVGDTNTDTDTLNSNSVDPQASFQEKTPAETAADTDIDTDTLNSNVDLDPQASFQAKTPAETAGVTDTDTATLNSNVDPQASFQANTPAETAVDTDTVTATLNSNVDLDPQAKTPVKDDEDHDAMSDDDGLDQMEDSDGYDDGDADYVPDDYEGPSTPGLWEEPNLPNIQETPTCDDESLKEKLENTSQKVTDYVPHQQEKSTPVDHMSIDDFGHQSISMTQGLEGVKETYYENAIEKEHGNDINTRDNWFKVQGNIENAYHPTTSHLVSNSETLNEHENNPTNVSSFHSLETTSREKENPSNFFGGSGLMQGEASHATNTFDLNLQEIHFTQSHDEDQVGCNLYNEQQYNVNQGDNINNNTNIYTSHFSSSERLLGVQERFEDVPQQDKTNVYTSHFQASERLPVVQERFQDVNQGINININTINTNIYTSPLLPVQERFSDHVTTQRDNTNSYTSHFPDTDRLLGVQEKFPQGDNVNVNINTSGYTSTFPTAADTLLGVQERFPQADNTNTYISSQISAPDRLLGVQERFQDATQGNKSNNTNLYTSSSSSSHFAPAERLLAVQERFSDAVLRQNTTPVQENLSRGDGGHFASGKKRSFNDSSMMSQSINFGDPSGLLTTTKITPQSVPNNDDILSSILVGRSSVMQVNPTPPPQKRRRQTAPKPPKSSVPPKRKVPMDDSTVLHGDMIRQQLTDTSDIRRPRKKVSCTWVELSMIHKQLWEDAIFHEALFTGMSIKLASLHSRSYDLRKIRVTRVESSSDAPPPPLQPVSQIDENVENAPEENLNLHEGNKDAFVENNTTNEEQMNATIEVREPITSETATIETDAALQSVQSDEKSEKTDLPSSVGKDASIDINSKYIDNKTDEIKIDIASPEKTSEAKDEVEVEVEVVVGPEVIAIDQEMEEIGKNENEEETPKPEVECNENNSVPEGTFGKQLEEADTENVTEVESCSKQALLDNNDKQVSDHEEDASQEETNIEEDSNPKNTVDDDEVEYSPVQNNTDFLNFDDEDENDAEEPDEDLSDTEEKRLIDNSGWSSRTKAVGKYLQNMFNKEEENGRKALRMNSLLNGKTRKEASRMFFETLVLKTKDYIHVEQSDAFENIEILPRSKLLKSDF